MPDLPARCFWEEQWLRYIHCFTIWKGSSDKQTTSPRRHHSPCCCRPWTTSTCLCVVGYSSALKATAIAQNNMLIAWRHRARPGSCQEAGSSGPEAIPRVQQQSGTIGGDCERTTSIHQLVKCQSSTKCSEVVNPSTVHLLTCHHPICSSRQYAICSLIQRLKQPHQHLRKAYFPNMRHKQIFITNSLILQMAQQGLWGYSDITILL